MSARILVPLDGSSFGQQALPPAISLARRTAAELHLVKVHMPPAPAVKGDTYIARAAQADRLEHEAEARYLDELAASVRASHDLNVTTAVLTGSVAPALEAYIDEQQISLVVITTHGRGGLSRAWFGSVADALVRTVSVPVLICRPQASEDRQPWSMRINHILVPLDGSPTAERAISEAVEIGALFDARFTLLQIVTPPVVSAVGMIDVSMSPQAPVEQLRRTAQAYLNSRAAPLRERGFQVDTAVVVQAQSAPGILEEASYRKADMIVMCTHGRDGWQRYALGSVADKVLRGAQVPVLMFRPASVPAVRSTQKVSEVFI